MRSFLYSQLKTMALAAQVLLGFGLLVAYFFRPSDPLFSWLATFISVGFVVTIGLFLGWQPALQSIMPFIGVLAPTAGFLYIGVALAITNVRPQESVRVIAVAAPFVLLPCALFDTALTRIILAASVTAIAMAAFVVAAPLLRGARYAKQCRCPSDVGAIFSNCLVCDSRCVRDSDSSRAWVRPSRSLSTTFVSCIYHGRSDAPHGRQPVQLDRSNETLNTKLAEREAELAAFHRLERVKAVNTVREQERQRLTHDLHDGLSGHLASIIALSERSSDKHIEQAARDALNDLRLVIYSLDLNDNELPLALANFRERLVPQLQRLGVELDWSTGGMPEVSGVTPGNALAVLRILQEAITNALKHGPARKITIRAALATDGKVAITVENDGSTFAESGGGHGLANMRRRAAQLHGKLHIESVGQSVKITLLLPSRLPDFEDKGVG